MSDLASKTSKSDRISQLVIEVDAMRRANPYMGVKDACGLVGLSKDTYYLRKREQRADRNDKAEAIPNE